ncbi:MotA/TolQ/ExbB proton channel family protein [Desulfobulbus propionicus]|jgi:biopolymer transport protein ExbB/TolQ
MDIGALLKTFIYLVSSSLLYPVLLALSLLVLMIIIQAGGFFAEWLERLRLRPCPSQDLPRLLQTGQARDVISHRVNRYLQALAQIRSQPGNHPIIVENLLQSTTLELWTSMDRLRILVRTGPSLGLLGTLIPMGTGLASLGQGDLTKLSSDLVIAFTTTVVGLAAGTVAFCFYTVRRRWLEEDIKNMELATELLMNPAAEN